MASFDSRLPSSFSSMPPHAPYANMTGSSHQNYPGNASAASRSFGAVNGGVRTGSSRQNPQIYTAVYSGVGVYEMELNAVAVMRRRSDSWLNATQILKVAGVDKGKRTKILEKEILTGQFEKVQGGYGRYQGTWINYNRGREFCRQYGVEDILRPLLDYDIASDGTGAASRVDTPTKEQAMAAQRKRFYNSSMENRVNGHVPGGTFFQNISPTASNALAAMNKAARFESPMPRPGSSAQRRPGNVIRRPSQQMGNSQDSGIGGSQNSMHSFTNDQGLDTGSADPLYGNMKVPSNLDSSMLDGQEPPRKKMRPSFSQDPNSHLDPALRDGTPTEPNESFVYQQNGLETDPGPSTMPPFFPSANRADEAKRLTLLELFADVSRSDFSAHPALINLSGKDLDIPLDVSANTALHWAATLARVPLMRLLISKGANIMQGNAANQTPLMAAVQVNNSFDRNCFADMLNIFGSQIEVRDAMGRTVLHHIAVSCGIKGRAQSSRSYLEALLEHVVRQGVGQTSSQSNPSSQSDSFGPSSSDVATKARPMNLGRFMSEVVNVQDKSGNTALNLVARIGNRTIIDQLEEVGADFDVPNHTGFRPTDFGVFARSKSNNSVVQPTSSQGVESSQEQTPSQMDQIREEIFATTESILSQTQARYSAELSKKQAIIDQQNNELRAIAQKQKEQNERNKMLQHRLKEREERRKRIKNLRHAVRILRKEAEERKAARSEGADEEEPLVRIDANMLPSSSQPSEETNQNSIDAEKQAYLQSLPPTPKLREIAAAYGASNKTLEEQLAALRRNSSEEEDQYRKIVCLCTGLDENHVENMLDGLIAAVESEGGEEVDITRVREFLRKVEGAEA